MSRLKTGNELYREIRRLVGIPEGLPVVKLVLTLPEPGQLPTVELTLHAFADQGESVLTTQKFSIQPLPNEQQG